jgi:nicotinate phosphoribosyltransferase
MNILNELYKPSLTLLTDLYQLTMAYGYWKSGMAEREAVFNLFFRKHPFNGGYVVSAGLEYVIRFLENFHFSEDDLAYLGELKSTDGSLLFEEGFIEYLRKLTFTCDVDAIPEGTLVFPHEPIVRVKGPILQCQLLETFMLNSINFQSLIATKAARITIATQGEPVLEFGLRRAQGIDGGLAASRAAYLGGCSATSNVLAGRFFGIPVRGTHAHSWVMSFDGEPEAFEAYMKAMPTNCVFLVDTYDTLEGVRHAVEAGRWLKERGYKMAGIRLDSGDLAYLSIEARKILDEGGFSDAFIVASNDLDETIIRSLKDQGAQISVWGVGTKLVTAYDQPALGGVYKMAAIRQPGGEWDYKLKLSEQTIKINNPGILQVRRFYNEQGFIADMIFDTEREPSADNISIIDPVDITKRKQINPGTSYTDLLVPIFKNGSIIYQLPALDEIRSKVKQQLAQVHTSVKRFVNPHTFPAGLEEGLYHHKLNLILKLKQKRVKP